MIKLFSSYHPARSRLANPSTACGHRPINSPSLSPIRSAQELLYANEFHTGHLCQWFRRRLHQRKCPHKLLDLIFLNNQHHARQCLPFQTSARQGRRIIQTDFLLATRSEQKDSGSCRGFTGRDRTDGNSSCQGATDRSVRRQPAPVRSTPAPCCCLPASMYVR